MKKPQNVVKYEKSSEGSSLNSKGGGKSHRLSESSLNQDDNDIRYSIIDEDSVSKSSGDERAAIFTKKKKPFNNIYIKNFPLTWTEEKLRSIFYKYGPILSI